MKLPGLLPILLVLAAGEAAAQTAAAPLPPSPELVSFADVYLRHPERFDPALVTALKQEFTREELAHMAIALTTFHALSRCAVSLGGMPESLPVMEMSVPV